MVVIIFILLTLILITIYLTSKRKYNYWKKKNIIYSKPLPFLGNYGDYIVLRKFVGEVTQKLCQDHTNEPYFGAFYGTEPTLIVQDPDMIKLVVTKDFYYFSSREISEHTDKEVITQNLFFTQGDKWKVVRQNLTPLFSSAKMKNMFHLIEKCSLTLEQMLDYEVQKSNVLEIRSLMARYTMDCIGACAFGVDTDVMGQNSDKNLFKKIGDSIFEISNYRGFKIIARAIWPSFFYGLGFKTFPTDVDGFFRKILTGVFESRGYNSSSRNDFIDLLLSLKKNIHITGDSLSNMKTGGANKVTLDVDDDLLVAQSLAFFAAGFETSSATLGFTLFELAKDENAQRRVVDEIDNYLQRHNNKLDYSCLTELPYLEACVDETLRLYPVLGVLTRELIEDYELPTGVCLDKGVRVHIPVYHVQRNPLFFPQPEEFRPDRFLHENKKDIRPYTYMPFGEGPRICIGMRFAKMQMLSGVVSLLKKYNIQLAEGMPRTLTFDPRSIVTRAREMIRLKFITRDNWELRQFSRASECT